MPENLLTVKDLAERWQVSPEWIYDAVAAGRIPSVRLGRQVRFRPDDMDAYLDRHTPTVREVS